MPHITVRSMTKEDIPAVVDVARKCEFTIAEESLESWNELDPGGIKIALIDYGDVIGMCGNVIHSDDFSFGGTFCVLEEYRLLDVGHQLFESCFEHGGNRNIGLNCSADKMNSYRRRGFTIREDSWSTVEYEYYKPIDATLLSDAVPNDIELVEFDETHLQSIFKFDLALVGYDRRLILGANCRGKSTKTYVAFKSNKCIGFGSAKYNIFGQTRIGPLYADNGVVAEALMRKLFEAVPPDKGLALVTMSSNFAANEFMKKLQVPMHANLHRLYSKDKLKVDTNKIFAQLDVDFSPF